MDSMLSAGICIKFKAPISERFSLCPSTITSTRSCEFSPNPRIDISPEWEFPSVERTITPPFFWRSSTRFTAEDFSMSPRPIFDMFTGTSKDPALKSYPVATISSNSRRPSEASESTKTPPGAPSQTSTSAISASAPPAKPPFSARTKRGQINAKHIAAMKNFKVIEAPLAR